MPFLEICERDLCSVHTLAKVQMMVLASMHWPDDLEARKSFIYSKAQDGIERRAVNDQTPSILPAWFLEARGKYRDAKSMIVESDPVVIRGAKKTDGSKPAMTGTLIAGEILRNALRLETAGHPVSLDRCLEQTSQTLRGCMNARPRELRSHWRVYKNVAPLWAASIALGIGVLRTDRPVEFGLFLQYAERLRQKGEGISVRNVGPFLDPNETWKVPVSVLSEMIGWRFLGWPLDVGQNFRR